MVSKCYKWLEMKDSYVLLNVLYLIIKMMEHSGHSIEHLFIKMLMRGSVKLYSDCTEGNFLLIKFSQSKANYIHSGVNKIILFFFLKKRYTPNNGLLWVFLLLTSRASSLAFMSSGSVLPHLHLQDQLYCAAQARCRCCG